MRVLAAIALCLLPVGPTIARTLGAPVSLSIDLRDGFKGEPVTVLVDGNEIVRLGRVVSSPVTGLANQHVHTTTAGWKKLEVIVGERGKEKSFRVELLVDRNLFIGVTYAHHWGNVRDVVLELSNYPFVYE